MTLNTVVAGKDDASATPWYAPEDVSKRLDDDRA